MTTILNNGDTIFVGSKIVIPEPQEDDTWINGMISEVDDIDDDGNVIFSDEDWDEHEIEITRVQLYKP